MLDGPVASSMPLQKSMVIRSLVTTLRMYLGQMLSVRSSGAC